MNKETKEVEEIVQPDVVEVQAPGKAAGKTKKQGPKADIADTARIMPGHLEEQFSRQEKIHPRVIINNQGTADKVTDEEFSGKTILQADAPFYLVRVGPEGSRRAAWLRVMKPEAPEAKKADK